MFNIIFSLLRARSREVEAAEDTTMAADSVATEEAPDTMRAAEEAATSSKHSSGTVFIYLDQFINY